MSAGSLQSWSNLTPQMWFHLNDWRLKRLDTYSVISLQSKRICMHQITRLWKCWKFIFFSEIWMQCFFSSLWWCTEDKFVIVQTVLTMEASTCQPWLQLLMQGRVQMGGKSENKYFCAHLVRLLNSFNRGDNGSRNPFGLQERECFSLLRQACQSSR